MQYCLGKDIIPDDPSLKLKLDPEQTYMQHEFEIQRMRARHYMILFRQTFRELQQVRFKLYKAAHHIKVYSTIINIYIFVNYPL